MKNILTYIIGLIVILFYALIYMLISSLILGLPLMWLWNWIMPSLFGLAEIEYLKSVGIILISNIIFKGAYKVNNE